MKKEYCLALFNLVFMSYCSKGLSNDFERNYLLVRTGNVGQYKDFYFHPEEVDFAYIAKTIYPKLKERRMKAYLVDRRALVYSDTVDSSSFESVKPELKKDYFLHVSDAAYSFRVIWFLVNGEVEGHAYFVDCKICAENIKSFAEQSGLNWDDIKDYSILEDD